jgi:hypothetical protein
MDAPDSLLRRLASVLQATAPVERLGAEAHDDEAFAELLDTLERRGLLVGAVPDDGGPLDDHVVVVEGDNPAAQLTADLLAGHATAPAGCWARSAKQTSISAPLPTA